MKIGILGVGRISEIVTPTLPCTPGAELYAVASRSLPKAQDFAARHGVKIAYGSYEELVSDPNVELIYIATPHSHHFEHMKLCIEHQKHFLCEKAFTVNAQQAKEIIALAKKAGVFVAEANWTRYMPSRQIIDDLIRSGIIGEVSVIDASLCYYADGKERIFDPNLAGGALLDVGVYGINLSVMLFGKEIDRIESSVQMMPCGVDAAESITIHHKNGNMTVLTHSVLGRSSKSAYIHGTKGYMVIQNIPNPKSIRVYDMNDSLILDQPIPQQITGYEYEFSEAIQCIESGKLESQSMPHAETLFIMELMDSIRTQWGMRFPME